MDDNERLCAMESSLPFRKFCLEQGLEPGTARSVGQHLTHQATGAPLCSKDSAPDKKG